MPVVGVGGMEERIEVGTGEAAETPFFDGAVGLVWRAAVLWSFVLLVLSLARALPL
jgi:adenosylcobinamide-phosphate synthase